VANHTENVFSRINCTVNPSSHNLNPKNNQTFDQKWPYII